MTSISQERSKLAAVGMRLRFREEAGFRFDYTTARTVDEPATDQFVHITITNPDAYSSDDAHARAVESIGINRFPSVGVSYNRLVMQSGRLYEGQPIGRRGAHTVNDDQRATCATSGCPSRGSSVGHPSVAWNLNYSARAYAICQNVDDPVTAAQLDSLARAVAADRLAGFVTRGARLHGHRCVSDKSCPADRMWALMGELKSKVTFYLENGLMSASGPASWDDADWAAFDSKGVTKIWFRDVDPDEAVTNAAWTTLHQIWEGVEQLKNAPPGSSVVASLTDGALASIADAVYDEQVRRMQAGQPSSG